MEKTRWRMLAQFFYFSILFFFKLNLFLQRLSDYTRDYQGKLYIYYLKREDAGEYECYLPDGRRSTVRLVVKDSNDQSGQNGQSGGEYAIRGSVESQLLKFKDGESVEQTCSGLTNGDSLNIEWFGPNNRVSLFGMLAL